MPDVLFIVTDDNNKIIYHCHTILELFRLRDVYKVDTCRVYRYLKCKPTKTGTFFKWTKATLDWSESTDSIDKGRVCFELISYEDLEASYNIIRRFQKCKVSL